MEVRRHPASGVKYQTDDHPLRRASSKVSLLSLEGKELDLFLEIFGAPTGDALGDGEAAVIAAAMSRGLDSSSMTKKGPNPKRALQQIAYLLDCRFAAGTFGDRHSGSDFGRRVL